MRKETTKERIVRTTTTGYVEADMLGHTLNVAEEMKAKQNKPQRPHREKSVSELLQEGFKEEQEQLEDDPKWYQTALKWFQTAPTACLRRLKAWENKRIESVPKYLSGVRKQKRNGK